MKENIVILFGGKSAEHDISIITGLQVIRAINKEKYNILPIYISKKNNWFIGDDFDNIQTYINFDEKDKKFKRVSLVVGERTLIIEKGKRYIQKLKVDCAVVCCHGMNGEDGTLQGLLSLCDIPYTSSNHISSSICMDKILMKYVFKANDMPAVDFVWFERIDYFLEPKTILKDINRRLTYPLIVKPSNLGSSIGITKCNNEDELIEAIEIAVKFDNRILVENALSDFREINCSVIGNSLHSKTSMLEEPKSWEDFLTFEDKYLNGNSKRQVGIKLPKKIEKDIRDLSEQAFKEFCCCGVIRIDFLLDNETGNIYINEINSIPGSMAYYLWADLGITFSNLIDRIIEYAKEEQNEKKKNHYSFTSEALINFDKSSGKIGVKK